VVLDEKEARSLWLQLGFWVSDRHPLRVGPEYWDDLLEPDPITVTLDEQDDK